MVTRPLMDSIASITRPSWRNGVGSTHWLRQAKRTIMSGMGGCSSCRLDWGIHSLHGARSPCLMWVDDAVGLSHLRFGEGIDYAHPLFNYIASNGCLDEDVRVILHQQNKRCACGNAS